jgi:two-component sensor histidine kinase
MFFYDRLYRSENYAEGSLGQFLENLIQELWRSLQNSTPIELDVHLEDFNGTPQVLMSLGMIVNELVTNSFKYAFIDKKTGIIRVSLTLDKLRAVQGFGWNLVEMTLSQICGYLDLLPPPGLGVRTTFPLGGCS